MGVESTSPGQTFKSIFKNTGSGGSFARDSSPGVKEFSIERFNSSGVSQETTPYPNAGPTTNISLTTVGYYVLTIPSNSSPITFRMWAWGAGGQSTGGPGTGYGGAGGGVRGEKTFTAPSTITIIVGATGTSGTGGFPDGGTSEPSYIQGGGGGSSRIGSGTIPFPTRNGAPATYLLIGGGGGGGSQYSDSGTYGGSAGYPSGNPGGGYYPSDGTVFGGGGTQSAGGAGGPGGRENSGSPGAKYSGGAGGGGAGGGGYYGGGGAGGYYAMGGGGSSYIDPSVSNSSSFSATPGTNHYLGVDDPSYPGTLPATGADSNNNGFVKISVIG